MMVLVGMCVGFGVLLLTVAPGCDRLTWVGLPADEVTIFHRVMK